MIVKPVESLVVGDRLPFDASQNPFVEQVCHTFASVRHIDGTYPVTACKRFGEEMRWEIDYYGHKIQAEAPVGTIIGVYPEQEHGDQAGAVSEA